MIVGIVGQSEHMRRKFSIVKLGSVAKGTIVVTYVAILLRIQLEIRVIIDIQMLVGVERNESRCPHRRIGFVGKVSLSQAC